MQSISLCEWVKGQIDVLLPTVSFISFPSLAVLVLLQALEEELKLNKCSSFELIEQYYLEKISHQVRFNLPCC